MNGEKGRLGKEMIQKKRMRCYVKRKRDTRKRKMLIIRRTTDESKEKLG